MKRVSIIIFAVILCCFTAKAQDSGFIDDIKVGAELGISVPTMRYSNPGYDPYKKSPLFSGMGGIFVDWNFYGNWSVRPHFDFVGRGVRMKYEPQFIDYKLKATYFDIRIPVLYTFKFNNRLQPYLAAGPSFNFATGGKIRYTAGMMDMQNYTVKLDKSNFKGFDFGVYFGAGLDFPIDIKGFPILVGAEVGYTLGFVDTFSKIEKNRHAIALNAPVYSIIGTRKNSNVSIAFSVSIPLKNLFGKKTQAKRQSKAKAPAATHVEEKVTERKITVQEKQCCSLEEMYELILNRKDISRKKICAFTDIRFDFDKATLRPESEEYLEKFIMILHKFPALKISIIGHTDNVGDSQYNLKLSKERAESVADYFIRNGIDASRLRCFGQGDRQPLDDNSTAEARARNRRVEFDIIEQ